MNQSWWQQRQWRFVVDMNGDGAVTGGDAWLWAQWLFFLPGDAVIALVGPSALGRWLELTPAGFGTLASGLISAPLWLLGVFLLACLPGFLVDAVDPTYRKERRERRVARARAQRMRAEQDRRLWAPQRRWRS